MTDIRYHLTTDGPRICLADKRSCPVGGVHFHTKEEALTALEFNEKLVHKSFNLFKKRPVDVHQRHLETANERIRELESELKERDARQVDGTLYHQLTNDSIFDELEERFQEEVSRRSAGIGYLRPVNDDAPVVGLVYSNDFEHREETALEAMRSGLNEGTYEPGHVLFYEKDGLSIFAVKGPSRDFGLGRDLDPLPEVEEAAFSRWKKDRDSHEYQRRWTLEKMSLEELQKETGDSSSSREELIERLMKQAPAADERQRALGELRSGQALVVVTQDPLESQLMKKLKEAHDAGALRVGTSAAPFSRGALFYDDRDVSRAGKQQQVKREEMARYANAYISPMRDRMEQMHGILRMLAPQENPDVQDIREVKYWLDWSPSGHSQVTGLFTRSELERMISGDFSVVDS